MDFYDKWIMLATIAFSTQAYAESTGLDKAIAFVKDACLHGKKIDIKASGNGDISFSKGVNGEVVVSASEVGAMVSNTSQAVRKEENNKIRECMQPHIAIIINLIATTPKATSTETSKPNDYIPKDQWVLKDIPLNIFDGRVLLVLDDVKEINRRSIAKISINIPHRQPHRMQVTHQKDPFFKNNYKFQFGDAEYKLTAEKVDLQGQKAKISIVKYRNMK